MQKNILTISCWTVISLVILNAGCASVSKDGDRTVVAASTQDGNRPFWTFDGSYNQEKLREEFDDSADESKDDSDKGKMTKVYFVERAHVEDNETLVPNCYQIAKTRALATIGSRISNSLKDSNVLGETQTDAAFERQLEARAKNTVVGAEQINKAWFKTEGAKKDKVISCWVVVSIKKENLEKLEGFVMKKLEKEATKDPNLSKRVHESLEAAINNPGPTQN